MNTALMVDEIAELLTLDTDLDAKVIGQTGRALMVRVGDREFFIYVRRMK